MDICHLSTYKKRNGVVDIIQREDGKFYVVGGQGNLENELESEMYYQKGTCFKM